MLSPVLGFIHSFQSTCYNTFTRRMSNGAKQGVAPVACAPPLFLPRPELKYIYVFHTSAPPRTYLVPDGPDGPDGLDGGPDGPDVL